MTQDFPCLNRLYTIKSTLVRTFVEGNISKRLFRREYLTVYNPIDMYKYIL